MRQRFGPGDMDVADMPRDPQPRLIHANDWRVAQRRLDPQL